MSSDTLHCENLPDYVSFESNSLPRMNVCVAGRVRIKSCEIGRDLSKGLKNSIEIVKIEKISWFNHNVKENTKDTHIDIFIHLYDSKDIAPQLNLRSFTYSLSNQENGKQRLVLSRKMTDVEKIELLNELLFAPVKLDSIQMDFDTEKNILRFAVHPMNVETNWSHLFNEINIGDKSEKYLVEEITSDEIDKINVNFNKLIEENSQTNFNLQQLEDVDFNSEHSLDNNLYQLRLCDGKLVLKNTIYLSGYQWLGDCQLANNYPSSKGFCIRYDVDGVVWIPKSAKEEKANSDCWLKHVATLQAFGFVLASKEDKRFVAMPLLDDGNDEVKFVALCDANLRVYIYCQPLASNSNPECEVRCKVKREGKESFSSFKVHHTAWQYVVSFDNKEDIIGFCAFSRPYSGCLVLTKKDVILLALQ